MSSFPESGDKWYMAGTDGSGKYMVVADGEYGRVGYREIKPEVYRIRFEPNTDDIAIIIKIKETLNNWCPPQSKMGGDTFRFSILGNGKSALRCGVDQAIKAMGGFGEINPLAPDWLRSLVDKPFDHQTEAVGKPLQGDGFWVGKTSSNVAVDGMFATWMTKKDTAYEADEDEPEDEPETEEETDEEAGMDGTPIAPPIFDYDQEILMTWMAEDSPCDGEYAHLSSGKKVALTTALQKICQSEAKKVGQNWNLGCTCMPCLRATKSAVKVYEQAKIDYAAKMEAEKPLSPEEQKAQAVRNAAEMAKAAMDLAATLKAFGF